VAQDAERLAHDEEHDHQYGRSGRAGAKCG
jgi:hypothetical protein